MSAFCGGTGSIPAFTSDEMRQLFPNGILPESLPKFENGLVSEDWIQTYVKKLEFDGRLPKASSAQSVESNMFGSPDEKDPLAEYVKKENEFQENLKKEYCFYEQRYFSALDIFLQSIADASLRDKSQNSIDPRLNITRELNQKLTLLTQIANGVSRYRYTDAQNYTQEINNLNSSLKTRQEKLLKQQEILQKESASAELHKRLVEYTTEKNKANQNILALYGVLNIVALAMVIYVARSS